MLARGRLAGEHDGARAVVNRVGNVGRFCTGRARVLNHRIQHLRRGDNRLARRNAALNQLLLQARHILQRHFYAQIAARHHHAVHHAENLVNVLHALHVLNFGNNVDGMAVILLQDVTNLHNIVRAARERSRNEIITILDGKENILMVFFADEGHRQVRIRNVDALVVAHHAAVEHAADDIRPINAFHLHPNQTVVNQDAAADGNVLRQFLVGDGHALFVALHLVSREGEQLAVLQRDTPIFERTHANFRALGVQHCGDRQPQFVADTAYFIVIMLMRFISAVREIEACDIHARFHQRRNQVLLKQVRAHRADDFRLANRRIHENNPPFS